MLQWRGCAPPAALPGHHGINNLTLSPPCRILPQLDAGDIYIVGGIVDRNRYKRLCADKAEAQGIRTARLPIDEYVALSSSRVMCTNHVVEIMIRQRELKDWGAAFEAVIPIRKRKAEGGESDSEDGSGDA